MSLQNATSSPFLQTIISNGMFAIPLERQIVQVNQSLNLNGSGYLNFYSVPTGYKAIIIGATLTNISGGSISNGYFGLEIGGVGSGSYINMRSQLVSLANNAAVTMSPSYIFNTGDNFGFNCGTASATVNISMEILLIPDRFPATSTYKNSFSGTGFYDTLYTVPANTISVFSATANGNLISLTVPQSPSIFVWQSLGAGLQAYNAYLVPPAGSPGTNNLITGAQNVGNASLSALIAVGTALTVAGTTIQVETQTGSLGGNLQAMFYTVFEFPT